MKNDCNSIEELNALYIMSQNKHIMKPQKTS